MNRLSEIYLLILLSAILLQPGNLSACTTFFVNKDGNLIFGKNYDWMTGTGILVVNKRGVSKYSFGENKIDWTSRYGSITFNQYGKEFPSGGMNEAGLVIELMWLDDTEYPAPDSRAQVGILQWIQYQLDNSKSVQDVIDSDSKVRPMSRTGKIHYLIADAEGNAASIEFLDGKMVYKTGEDMPVTVLTNNTYDSSLEYLNEFNNKYGTTSLPQTKSSYDRFVKACRLIRAYDPAKDASAIDYSFDILSDVSQGEFTHWSIVYDIKAKEVYFNTRDNRKIRSLSMEDLNFGCDAKDLAVDLEADIGGDLSSQLTGYNTKLNTDIIRKAYSEVPFLKNTGEEDIIETGKIPELYSCNGTSSIMKNNVSVFTKPGSGIFFYIVLITSLSLMVFVSVFLYRRRILGKK